ncbi:hypothetical protein KAS08_03635 [Candidatus Pacearchaeota archaeon]|nr:hypothetical protein [Candidatus Pacearchaeota archaeon]
MNRIWNAKKNGCGVTVLVVFLVMNFCFVVAQSYDEVREVNYGEALGGLMKAEGLVSEMEAEGFSSFFVKDTLLEAKRYFIGMTPSDLTELFKLEIDGPKGVYLEDLIVIGEETPSYERKTQDYFQSAKLAYVIVQRRDQAYRILDEISLFEEKEAQYKKDGVITDDARVIFEEAKVAFEGERYDDAELILGDANLELTQAAAESQRIKSAIKATQGFLVRYWWQILLVLLFLGGISVPITKKVNRYLKEKKLSNFRIELVSTRELLKQAQENCFNAKTITTATYRLREKRYKENMVKIQNEIKILEKVLGQESKIKNKNANKTIGLKV